MSGIKIENSPLDGGIDTGAIARDGSRPPTADQDWSGFDILNIENIQGQELRLLDTVGTEHYEFILGDPGEGIISRAVDSSSGVYSAQETADTDRAQDNQYFYYSYRVGASQESLALGFDSVDEVNGNFFISTTSAGFGTSRRPLNIGYDYNDPAIRFEDAVSIEINRELRADDNSDVDAVAAPDLRLRGADKLAGTGAGGALILSGGSGFGGGLEGVIQADSNVSLADGARIFFNTSDQDFSIRGSENDEGLLFLSETPGTSAYHNFSTIDQDGTDDNQIWIYGFGGDFALPGGYHSMFFGFDSGADEYTIGTRDGGGEGIRPIVIEYGTNGHIRLEDSSSIEFGVGTLRRDDVTSGAGSPLTVRGGNSTDITGGNLNLLAGSGSPNGSINIGTSPIASTINIGGTSTDFIIAARTRHADGTEALPSIAFNSDPALGLYKKGVDSIGISDGGSDMLTISSGTLDITGTYLIDGSQVVSNRQTGWAAPTGTATRTTFATTTVTTEQLAERVKALIDDLTSHGMIGS